MAVTTNSVMLSYGRCSTFLYKRGRYAVPYKRSELNWTVFFF